MRPGIATISLFGLAISSLQMCLGHAPPEPSVVRTADTALRLAFVYWQANSADTNIGETRWRTLYAATRLGNVWCISERLAPEETIGVELYVAAQDGAYLGGDKFQLPLKKPCDSAPARRR
jgi:hypothetical protein